MLNQCLTNVSLDGGSISNKTGKQTVDTLHWIRLTSITFLAVTTSQDLNNTTSMALVSLTGTMNVEVTDTKGRTIQNAESVITLLVVPSLSLASAKQMEVARDPSEHMWHVTRSHNTSSHDFLSQLGAAAIHVQYIGTNTEVSEFRA
jgi:hypothetical protein